MILCIVLISLSECRTAIIVIAAYCFFEFIHNSYCNKYVAVKKRNKFGYLIVVSITIFACFLVISFDIAKLNSLNGRAFILLNSLNMFQNSPLIGNGGLGCYAVNYAQYQSEWFSTHHCMGEEFILADNVMYASNEYVQALCEIGLCGVIAATAFICSIIFSLRRDSFLLYCLVIPLIIAATFYYILHIALFCAIVLLICIIASCRSRRVIIINKGSTILLFVIVACGIFVTSYNIRHYYTAKLMYQAMEHRDITRAQAVDVLKRYGENRALMMLLTTSYTDSTGEIYKRVERNFLHSDMLWVEGRNLLRTGRDSLDEQKLLLASKIVPNRFRYNHELLQLYKRRGDTLKCCAIAEKILCMPVKIPSPTVTAIKIEAKKVLDY